MYGLTQPRFRQQTGYKGKDPPRDSFKPNQASPYKSLVGRGQLNGDPPDLIPTTHVSTPRPEYSATTTIKSLTKTVNLLKGSLHLLHLQLLKTQKARAFDRLRAVHQLFDPTNLETLTSEQHTEFKNRIHLAKFTDHYDFAKNLQEKIDLEKQRQEEVVAGFKTEFYEMQDRFKSGCYKLEKLVEKLEYHKKAEGFTGIEMQAQYKVKGPERQARKNYVFGKMALFFERKRREIFSQGFRSIKHVAEYDTKQSKSRVKSANLRTKGRILLNCLQRNSQLTVQKAFWKLYFTNTSGGQNLILNAVDHLALYANINTESAFYRFKKLIRPDPVKTVDVKVKRMGLVLFFLVEVAAVKRMREAFRSIEKVKKTKKEEVAKRIMKLSQIKIRKAFEKWRQVKNKEKNRERQKKEFAKRLLSTKIGKAIIGFKTMRALPQRFAKIQTANPNKFEKGLDTFIRNRIKYAFDQFKQEDSRAQVHKKRAIVVMFKTCESNTKRKYDLWHHISQQSHQVRKCKELGTVFSQLNFVVKSIANIVMDTNTKAKQEVIRRMFDQTYAKLKDSFKYWKQNIISPKDRKHALNGLVEFEKSYRKQRLREIIRNFRTNKNIHEIKKKFLNRLLQSKIGQVAVAYRSIYVLPQRFAKIQTANPNKFEKGLDTFIRNRIKYAFDQFKQEDSRAQVHKKRAIVVMFKTCESNTKRKYDLWHHISQQSHQVRKCKELGTVFSQLNFVVKSIANIVMDTNTKAKQEVIRRMFDQTYAKLKDSFKYWKQNIISPKDRKHALNGLVEFEKSYRKQRLREIIRNFRTNKNIHEIKKKFLNRLLQSKIGQVVVAYRSIYVLPQRFAKIQTANPNKFEKGLDTFIRNRIKYAFDQFKQEDSRAQVHKKRAIVVMFKTCESNTKRKYDLWHHISQQSHQVRKCKELGTVFSQLNFVVKSIANIVMDTNTKAKQEVIRRMFDQTYAKLKDSFKYWKQNIISPKDRKHALNGLVEFEKSYRKQRLREIIRNFRTNKNIHEIKKKFLNRLLQSKIGQVVVAYRSIYVLPQRFAKIQTANPNKFEKGLDTFIRNRIKYAFDQFKQEDSRAQVHKKRAIVVMFKTCESNTKRKYDLWHHISQQSHQVRKCKELGTVFSQLNFVVKSIANIVMDTNTKAKQEVIRRMFDQAYAKLKDSFKYWKQNIISPKDRKHALNGLVEFEKSYRKQRLREIIRNFRTNKNIHEIKKKFLNRLLQSKIGQVAVAYRSIYVLPQRFAKIQTANPNKFEKGLDTFIRNRIKYAFDQFKQEDSRAQVHKKRAIVVMFKTCESNTKRKYDLWHHISQQSHQVRKCKELGTVFSQLNFVVKSIANIVMDTNTKAKQEVIRRMFDQTYAKLKDSFKYWKQNIISPKDRKHALNGLVEFEKSYRKQRLREIIRNFRTNKNIHEIKKKFLNRLLQSKIGQVVVAYRSIYVLPQRFAKIQTANPNKFEKGLDTFIRNRIKYAFDQFKQEDSRAQVHKKRAIVVMFKTCESNTKRKYDLWHHISQQSHQVRKCKELGTVFSQLNFVVKSIANIVMDTNTKAKQEVIRRMFDQTYAKLKDSFKYWKQNIISPKDRKHALNGLVEFEKSYRKQRLREIIRNFRTNKNIHEIKKKFLNRLLQSKIGQVAVAYRSIYVLPQRFAKIQTANPNKFEKGLDTFIRNRIKYAFDQFKQEDSRAQVHKKRAIVVMFKTCESNTKRKYDLWHHISQQSHQVRKCKELGTLIPLLNDRIKQINNYVFEPQRDHLQQKKKYIMVLVEFEKSYRKQRLREIIRNFRTNKNIHEIKKKFLNRLLQSKIGQVAVAYRSIYVLPQRFAKIQTANPNKFEKGLDTFIRNRIKYAFDQFKQEDSRAQVHKKRAIVVMFKTCESNTKRKYDLWHHISQQSHQVRKCKELGTVFSQLNFVVKSIANIVMDTNTKAKQEVIRRMFDQTYAKLKDSFKYWKQNIISPKDRKHALNGLVEFEKSYRKQRLREIIRNFRTNKNIHEIKKKFLNRLLQSKIGQVAVAYRSIYVLPQRFAKIQTANPNKFEKGLDTFIRNRIKYAFDQFKQEDSRAQVHKKRAIVVMFKTCESNTKRKYDLWHHISQQSHQVRKCKELGTVFSQLNFVVKSIANIVMDTNTKAKQEVIRRMFDQTYAKLKDSFKYWKQNIISPKDRKHALNGLVEFEKSYRKQRLREIIRNFRTNKNIHEIKKKFLNRLLQSKIGQVVVAYRSIYVLPQRFAKIQTANPNKFEKGLDTFIRNRIKYAFDQFKQEDSRAQVHKKRAIVVMFKTCESNTKRKYDLWHHISQQSHQVRKCKELGTVFSQLNFVVKSIANIVMDTNTKAKQEVIRRMFDQAYAKLKDSFKYWKQNIISPKDRKHALNGLVEFEKSYRKQRLREIIRNFRTNKNIHEIKKKFLNRLLQSKIGQVAVAYRSIYVLPQRFAKIQTANPNKFEKGLDTFIRNRIKYAFDQFKQEDSRAQVHKKRAIVVMFKTCESNTKRKYDLWHHISQQSHQVRKCKELGTVFSQLNFVVKSIANIVMDTNTKAKQEVIRRMFDQTYAKLKDSFKYWKQNIISPKDRKHALNGLVEFEKSYRKQRLREIIRNFRTNKNIHEIKKKFLNRLLQSKIGQVVVAYRSIYVLPQRFAKIQTANPNKFEKGLDTFIRNRIKYAFDQFKQEDSRAQVHKKRAIVVMFKTCESNTKRKYDLWHHISQQSHQVRKCKELGTVFSQLNFVVKSIANIVMDTNTKAKQEVIRRMFDQTYAKLKDSFKYWKQNIISPKDRKHALNGLVEFEKSYRKQRLREIIRNFRTNKNIHEIKKKFLNRLLQSKIGQVAVAYRSIYVLPQRFAKIQTANPNKFEKGLDTFIRNRIKYAFDQFKQEDSRAQVHKKRAIVVMFKTCESNTKRKYDLWHHISQQSHQVRKCKELGTLIPLLNDRIKQINNYVFEPQRDHLQQKKKYIMVLVEFEKSYRKQRLREIIRNFRTNKNIHEIKKKFLNRLLQSKIGQVAVAYRSIYVLPQRFAKIQTANPNKFEKGLDTFIRNRIKYAFDQFKQEDSRAQVHKKRAIVVMFKTCESNTKRKYDLWHHISQQSHLVMQCRLLSSVIPSLNDQVKSITGFVFQPQRDHLQKKKKCLSYLVQTENIYRQYRLRKIIHNFKMNKIIREIIKKFLHRLLQSKAGRAIVAFKRIQGLPQRFKTILTINPVKFEKGLDKFIRNRFKYAFDQFKQQDQYAKILKKRATVVIAKTGESKIKRNYDLWHHISQQSHLVKECRGLSTVFPSLNNRIKSITNIIFKDKSIDTLQALGNLVSIYTKNRQDRLRKIIINFKINKRIRQIQNKFLQRLLKSKAGRVQVAFKRIQALPQRWAKIQTANPVKFEKGLDKFIRNRFKYAFDQFKQQDQYAKILKKRATVVIAKTGESKIKRNYDLWHHISQQSHLVKECRGLSTVFPSLNNRIKSITNIIFKDKSIDTLQALGNLVSIYTKNRQDRLRKIIINFKINKRIRQIQNKFLQRLLKSKAGRVQVTFKRIQALPQRWAKIQTSNPIRFEKGLDKFIRNRFRSAFDQFKRQNQYAKILKKRATVVIAKTGESKIKRNYDLWHHISQQSHLVRECRAVSTVFASLNHVFKSITDKVYVDKSNDTLKALRNFVAIEKKHRQDRLRKIIINFKINKRIREIQKKFLDRLLKSKTGRVEVAFKRIQGLPQRFAKIQTSNPVRFESGLDKFIRGRFKRVFDQFKRQNQQAKILKKRATVVITKTGESKMKRNYDLWHHISQQSHLVRECRAVGVVFASLNHVVKSKITDKLFVDKSNDTLKALRNLFVIEKKYRQDRLRKIIINFKINKRIREIQKKFLQRLLKSKAGRVQVAFKIIRSLTQRFTKIQTANPIRFEKGLDKFIRNRFRSAFDQFKRQNQYAKILKKRATVVIAKTGESKMKRNYDLWHHISQQSHLVRECKATNSVFASLNFVVKSIADNAFADNLSNRLKKQVLDKIFSNVHIRWRQSFQNWRSNNEKVKTVALDSDRVKKQSAKTVLEIYSGLRLNRLRKIVRSFNANKSVREIQKRFLDRVLRQKRLCVSGIFNKIRALMNRRLPDTKTKVSPANANKFEQGLSGYARRRVKFTFDQFKMQNEQAKLTRRNTIVQMFRNMDDKSRQCFQVWKTKKDRNRQTETTALRNLAVICKGHRAYRLRDIIRNFKINKRIREIQKRFLDRLLLSKAGLAAIAFKLIRSLPQRFTKIQTANPIRFEKGLDKFIRNRFRSAFDQFKRQNQYAKILKKRATVVIAKTGESKMKRNYDLWHHISQQSHLVRECKATNSVFASLNFVVKSIADNAFADNLSNRLKKQVLDKIFSNVHIRWRQSFQNWRSNNEKVKTVISDKDRVKRQSARTILEIYRGLRLNRLRQIVRSFKTNRRIREIQMTVIRRLLMSKTTCIGDIFRIIKNLPNRVAKLNTANANKFEQGLSGYARRRVKFTFDQFKMQNEQAKLTRRNTIVQMFRNMDDKSRQCFQVWKTKKDRNRQTETTALRNLAVICKGHRAYRLRDIIRNFKINKRIREIQKRFLDRLLLSKAGLAAIAFKLIRSLPQRFTKIQTANPIRFEKGLDKFIRNRFRSAFDQFKRQNQYAKILKKRATVVIAKTGESKMKRNYDLWHHISQQSHLVRECKATNSVFASLNFVVKSIADNAFADNLSNRLKKQVLDKIFSNVHIRWRQSFQNWRSNNEKVKTVALDSDRVKKQSAKTVLEIYSGLRLNRLRKIVRSFNTNKSVREIQKRFLDRVLRQKRLCVSGIFNKIRALMNRRLPDTKTKVSPANANKFEQGLSGYARRRVKFTFDQFKMQNDQAKITRRNAIVQMFRNMDDKSRQCFQVWKTKKDRNRQTETTALRNLAAIQRRYRQNRLRDIIRNFKINKRIREIHKKFLQRLLKSKAGLAEIAFKRIQALPQRWAKIQTSNPIRFEKGLDKFIRGRFKRVFDQFKRQNEYAKILKKRATVVIAKTGESKMKRNYDLWHHISQQSHLVRECRAVSTVFASLNHVVKSKITDKVYVDKSNDTLKALRNFAAIEKKHRYDRLRKIIINFKINKRIREIQKKFLDRLLKSKTGRVEVAFKRIQGLPQRFAKIQTSNPVRFESGLDKFIRGRFKRVFDQFKRQNQQAKILKKRATVVITKTGESKMKRNYDLWHHISQQSHLVRECRAVGVVFASLNHVVKSKITDKLFVDKSNDTLKALRNLSVIEKKYRQDRLRKIIINFKINKRIREIQKKFLQRLLKSKAGRVQVAFKIIRSLTQRFTKIQTANPIRFEKGLDKFIRNRFRSAFDQFKRQNQYAKILKKRATVVIAKTGESKMKRNYDLWHHISQQSHLVRECRAVSTVFASLNHVFKSITDKVYVDKSNDTLKVLRNFVAIEKKHRQDRLRKIIINFKINKRIREIQKKFLDRLLKSKTGRVEVAFKRIQGLPQRFAKIQPSNPNTFQLKLDIFYRNRMKYIFDQFKQEDSYAKILKKRATVVIAKTGESKMKRNYDLWHHISQQSHQVRKCKELGMVFASLNFVAKSIADNVFVEQAILSRKRQVVIKIVDALHARLKHSFSIWKEKKDKKRQDKGTALRNLISDEKRFRQYRLRQIIRNFNTNKRIRETKKRFLDRLLKSKTGMAAIAFKRIQALPQRFEKLEPANPNRFQLKLDIFYRNRMKYVFDQFRQEDSYAQVLKKRAIVVMTKTGESKIKRKYDFWHHITEQSHQVRKCKEASTVFASLNFVAKSIADNAFAEQGALNRKRQVVAKIVDALRARLKHSFSIWKEKKDKKRQDKGTALRNLISDEKRFRQYRLRQIIRNFNTNKRIRETKKRFLDRLLKSKTGMAAIAFKRIQALPQRFEKLEPANPNRFQLKLDIFYRNRMKYVFDQFRQEDSYAQVLKKRAIVVMTKTGESKIKRKYDFWHHITEQSHQVRKCKEASTVFASLNFVAKSIADNAFAEQGALNRKRQVVAKIVDALRARLKHSFSIWKEKKDKKRQDKGAALRNLISDEKRFRQYRLRQIIRNFNTNKRIRETKKRFLDRLLKSKTGMAAIAFKRIQALPERFEKLQPTNPNRFQLKLDIYHRNRMKYIFDQFKQQNQQAKVHKKRASIVIIKTGWSKLKKTYNLWHHIVSQIISANKCNQTLKFFTSINASIIKSTNPYVEQNDNTRRIKDAIKRIYRNQVQNMVHATHTWRDFMKNQRVRHGLKEKQKKLLLQSIILLKAQLNQRLKSQIISKFRKNAHRQSLKKHIIQQIISTRVSRTRHFLTTLKSLPPPPSSTPHHALTLFHRLHNLLHSHLHQTFTQFKSTSIQAVIYKRNSAIMLAENCAQIRRDSFKLWRKSFESQQAGKKVRVLGMFMETLAKVQRNSMRPLLEKRNFRVSEIKLLNRVFTDWHNTAINNRKHVFELWRLRLHDFNHNPWFSSAARILCLHSRINMQKALLRMKFFALDSQQQVIARGLNKLAKIINNKRKNIMAKSFWSIEKKGDVSSVESSVCDSRSLTLDRINSQRGFFNQDTVNASGPTTGYATPAINTDRYESIIRKNQLLAMNVLSKYTKNSHHDSFKKWMFAALPNRRAALAKQQITKSVPKVYSQFLLKLGAIDKLSDLFTSKIHSTLSHTLKKLTQNKTAHTLQQQSQRLFTEVSNLRTVESQADLLRGQLEARDRSLKIAHDTIKTLTEKINQTATVKFAEILQGVMENKKIEFYNEALDLIIEKANEQNKSGLSIENK